VARAGLPEKATHDYKRNGTTTLFWLEVATGKVTDQLLQPSRMKVSRIRTALPLTLKALFPSSSSIETFSTELSRL
jgi:hypothetical protein